VGKNLVLDAEKHYHHEIDKVAQQIVKKKRRHPDDDCRRTHQLGKTTTTIKDWRSPETARHLFLMMNLDNYFKNLDMHPKDEFEDLRFERPTRSEIALINEHLSDLLKGKTIQMPHFTDFKKESGAIK